jgi:SAM-dependent methyltransferase
MSSESQEYIGQELDIFLHARRWKAYWIGRIERWIAGDVLEMGAGIGANTAALQNSKVASWLCLEPDLSLKSRLETAVAGVPGVGAALGTIAALGGRMFDCILYIDVLEHIEHDRDELDLAAQRLRPGGRLIVLAPAHPWLYSPFDAAIGHYRRYTRASLMAISPSSCRQEAMFYLDAAGLFASGANRVFLKQSQPTLRQILFWDNYIVPVSKRIDPLFGYRCGKSVVGVWVRK